MDRPPSCKLQRLAWQDELLGSIELPKKTLRLTRSFGSGLSRRSGDPPGEVWAVGDRGPNLKIETLVEHYGAYHLEPLRSLGGAKVMPRLDVGPAIARLRVTGDGVELVEMITVTDRGGRPLSGLPMPGSEHSVSEPALSLAGERLDPDPSGLDTEGVVALEDGSFILSDEFGPSLLRMDEKGRVVGRYVPAGIKLEGAGYPVHETLPAIAAKRQLNRGFEAIATSCDQKWLFVAFQSPLAHPDEAAHEQGRHIRVWRIDLATMQVAAQYLYPLDAPGTFLRDNEEQAIGWSDLKISELVCLNDGSLLALERASKTTKIYRLELSEDCVLPSEHLQVETRPTFEQLSAAGEKLTCLSKRLLLSSDDFPELSPDLEGIAVLSPTELLLVNDSDFGVEGAETAFWKAVFQEPVFG